MREFQCLPEVTMMVPGCRAAGGLLLIAVLSSSSLPLRAQAPAAPVEPAPRPEAVVDNGEFMDLFLIRNED
jgi:hypothetical protein